MIAGHIGRSAGIGGRRERSRDARPLCVSDRRESARSRVQPGPASLERLTAIRERGLTLVEGDDPSRARGATRLERPVALLVVAVKALRPRRRARPDRAGGARRRASSFPCSTASSTSPHSGRGSRAQRTKLLQAPPAVAAGSIGSMSAHSPEPGLVVQGTPPPGSVTAASRDLDRERLAAALAPLRVPGIDVVRARRRGRGAVGEGGAARGARGRDRRLGAARWARSATTPAWRGAPAGGAGRGRRGRARPTGCGSPRRDQWAKIEHMPAESDDVGRAGRRRGEADRARRDHGLAWCAPVSALGVATPALPELLEEASCRAR